MAFVCSCSPEAFCGHLLLTVVGPAPIETSHPHLTSLTQTTPASQAYLSLRAQEPSYLMWRINIFLLLSLPSPVEKTLARLTCAANTLFNFPHLSELCPSPSGELDLHLIASKDGMVVKA